MAHNVHLTLACGDYEILRALKEGEAAPDGVDLTILTKMDSTTRHWRFLRNNEFDIAELSGSSYLMARDQGMPIDAIPVFPHRRFRHGFVFINTTKGIKGPKDLIGRKVGVKSFQATAILWMRGILEHEYGVPHKSIEWFSDLDEDIEFKKAEGLRLTRLPDSTSIEKELVEGRIDAALHTDLIEPIVEKDPRVARLFADHHAEEKAFYMKTGMFPIMHVVGIRRSLVEKHPWLPINLYKAFNESKAAGMKRMFNPRVVPLAWYTEYWEEERAMLGPDPWEYGLTDQNRKTLEAMLGYSHEQGLIRKKPKVDELFLDVSEGKKRGSFRV